MARYLASDRVRHIQRQALAKGGNVRTFADGHHSRTVEWDISGRCTDPQFVLLHGRKERKIGDPKMVDVNKTGRPNFVEMWTRCRKCASCLRYKAYVWKQRAETEYLNSGRTWLATFTLNDTSRTIALAAARDRLRRASVDYDALPGDAQFIELDRQIFFEIQKWLKRLRKNASVQIRYLAITEAHKSGEPHYHLLIHEPEGKPLSYDKNLKGTWPYGFQTYKLVRDKHGASYVAKYLNKAVRARVRASKGYGDTVVIALPPQALFCSEEKKKEKKSPEQKNGRQRSHF